MLRLLILALLPERKFLAKQANFLANLNLNYEQTIRRVSVLTRCSFPLVGHKPMWLAHHRAVRSWAAMCLPGETLW
jgi:hypothetical protein